MSRTDKDTPYHIRVRENIDTQTLHHHPDGECAPTRYRYSHYLAHNTTTLRCPRNTRTFQCRHNPHYDAHQNTVDEARAQSTGVDTDTTTNQAPFHLTTVTSPVEEALHTMLLAGFLPDCTMQHTHTLTEGEVLLFLDVLAENGRHTTPTHVFLERIDATGVTLAQQFQRGRNSGENIVSEPAVRMGVTLLGNPTVTEVVTNPDIACPVCDRAGTCFVYVPLRNSGAHDESCSCQRRRKVREQEDKAVMRRYLHEFNGAGRKMGASDPSLDSSVDDVREYEAASSFFEGFEGEVSGGSTLVFSSQSSDSWGCCEEHG